MLNYSQAELIQRELMSIPGAISKVLIAPSESQQMAQDHTDMVKKEIAHQHLVQTQGMLQNLSVMHEKRQEREARRLEDEARGRAEAARREADQAFQYDLMARREVARQFGKRGGNPGEVARLFTRDGQQPGGQAPAPQPKGRVRRRGTGQPRVPAPTSGAGTGGTPPTKGLISPTSVVDDHSKVISSMKARGIGLAPNGEPKPAEVWKVAMTNEKNATTPEEKKRWLNVIVYVEQTSGTTGTALRRARGGSKPRK
jgi:hypothetical protein